MKYRTITASFLLCLLITGAHAQTNTATVEAEVRSPEKTASLRVAVEDLTKTFGNSYPNGKKYLENLEEVDPRRALLANPLVSDHPILFVVRHPDKVGTHEYLGKNTFAGKGSALKLLDVKTDETTTLVENPNGHIRSPCVNFDGKRVLFSMNPEGENFSIFELNTAHTEKSGKYKITRLTFAKDVSDVDPMYLPGGDIIFASSRNMKIVPCDFQIVPQLFRMTGQGGNIHQITRSLVHENQVSLMPDGRVLYSRWDYVDRNFADGHGFWVTNPDGSNQAIIWGNNTAHPSSGWNARMIPGTGKLVCILGTHHGSLGGSVAVLDPSKAIDGYDSIERTWPKSIKDEQFKNLEMLELEKEKQRQKSVWKAYNYWPEGAVELAKKDPNLRLHRWEDTLRDTKPWYDQPWPLTDAKFKNAAGKYFLCARAEQRGKGAAIYLIDVFGNEIKIHEEAPGCYSPMPLAPTPKPVNMPPRRDYKSGNGYFYVQNVYEGTHMDGVKKGSVKYLRVVATPDKEGFSGGSWNCLGSQSPGVNWSDFNTKRILGTVPVAKDGSAYFAVPSDRFIHFQLLDKDGMMIQTMRGGTSIHSGETQGCVGCHESRLSATPSARTSPPKSLRGKPAELKPWHGPTRRFSYMQEIQPVLDKHCVKCHDFGKKGAKKILLSSDRTLMFNFSYSELWYKGYVGAIGAGPAGHLPPYTWGSHKSKLIQMLLKGHSKVKLSKEEMNRLITWVDINGPYYPTTVSSNGGGGRSASRKDLRPILKITKKGWNDVFRTEFYTGPLVNIDRPELSPCLSKYEKSSATYTNLLHAIQNVQKNVKKNPRGDVMEGLVPHPDDAHRIAHRKKYREYELKVREAIREGKVLFDSDFK